MLLLPLSHIFMRISTRARKIIPFRIEECTRDFRASAAAFQAAKSPVRNRLWVRKRGVFRRCSARVAGSARGRAQSARTSSRASAEHRFCQLHVERTKPSKAASIHCFGVISAVPGTAPIRPPPRYGANAPESDPSNGENSSFVIKVRSCFREA